MYLDDFTALEGKLPADGGTRFEYDGVSISRIRFDSQQTDFLPEYEAVPGSPEKDREIGENKRFPVYIFKRTQMAADGDTIILLHGLNEKIWNKYLPWARELCLNTGKTVILFPIAFHMDRAPAEWSSPRTMRELAMSRQTQFNSRSASFMNAALSARLHSAPERFYFSGMEAYFDVLSLIDKIRGGLVPGVNPAGGIDFFGYSIGSFLSLALLLADPKELLTESRAVLFCGGTTLDLMQPESRYILDSTATWTLKSYFSKRFFSDINTSPGMAEISRVHPETARVFSSLAVYDYFNDIREKLMKKITGRVSAILLKNDRVMPAEAVKRTLSVGKLAVSKALHVLDFPFPSTHEQPFPLMADIADQVNRGFRRVFGIASEQLA